MIGISDATTEIRAFPLHRFSVGDYRQMLASGILRADDAVELLEGCIVPASPHNPPHDGTVTVVQKALEPLLPQGWFVRIQSAIETADSAPEPDLAIVRGPYRRYLRRHPTAAEIGFVVEISDSTIEIDRALKGRIYAHAGIACYWVVNLTEDCVEVYSNPRRGSAPGYREKHVYLPGDAVPVVLNRRRLGEVAVRDLV